MKIKCIITDDEPIARKGLRGYIEKVDFLTLTGECEDAVQLNTILKTQEIDLLFLDIEMPEMTGIESPFQFKHSLLFCLFSLAAFLFAFLLVLFLL